MFFIFLVLTAIFWGSHNVFYKLIGNQSNYLLVFFISGLLQCLVVLPFIFNSLITSRFTSSQNEALIGIFMGLFFVIGNIFFFYTIKDGAVFVSTIPILTIGLLIVGVLGGVLFFSENLSLKILLGIGLGIMSILLLSWK